jgi:predicted MPP superfamily phosphohydrolase
VLLALRAWRRAAAGAGTALAVLAASGGVAAATFDPRAIAQPRYDGLLTLAPAVVGDAEQIVGDVSRYGEQLAQLVGNVTQLYDAASTLPAYTASEDTVRVLSVSDIHLNPVAYDVIRSVSQQFRTDLVIDTGDLTDRGSSAEGRFAALIGRLDQPYVFIRGNHDSVSTEAAVAGQPNARVLREGDVVEVEGLRIAGIGDPRFTPDKTTRDDDGAAPTVLESGERLAERVRELAEQGEPVDVALVHDPEAAAPLDGEVPLVLAGHGHEREVRTLEGGTLLFEQGSTGGAGLRGLEGEEPTPVQLSVLYLDRTTGELQAWDDIDVGGLGLTSARIERHLAAEELEAAGAGATPAAPAPAGR